MLTLFFTIIFLSELIVASWIINKINQTRRTICELNEQIINIQPVIKENINTARNGISKTLNALNIFVAFIAEKKCQCNGLVKNNILTILAKFIRHLPIKQIISILEIILTLRKFMKK